MTQSSGSEAVSPTKNTLAGGRRLSRGNIDHVAIGVNDVEASTAFYSTIAAAAGLTIRQQTADHAAFSVGASDGSFIVIAGEPTQNVHVAFAGEDDDVRRFHADATAAGHRSNGEPGERPRLPLDRGRGVALVVSARWYSTRRWTGGGGNPLAHPYGAGANVARIAILPARRSPTARRSTATGAVGPACLAPGREASQRELERGDRVARERTEQRRAGPC
jgi:catechol 2,3-dioxygenase-like lactoylglutathione lyase family enzyme